MEELLKLLDENLEYINHQTNIEEIQIKARSNLTESRCPYCGCLSSGVHSRALRKLKDLPIQGKKVNLILEIRKYFCINPECDWQTFAERFAFAEPRATKTNRLQDEILRVSLVQSSISASRYLKESVADVGKSTICNLLKKGREKRCGENGDKKHLH